MSLSDLPNLMAAQGFTERDEPISLFEEWLKDAGKSEPNDPNGMALATVDADGMPNVRMVLLKAADDRGFVFFTNYESKKGRDQGNRQSRLPAIADCPREDATWARCRWYPLLAAARSA